MNMVEMKTLIVHMILTLFTMIKMKENNELCEVDIQIQGVALQESNEAIEIEAVSLQAMWAIK